MTTSGIDPTSYEDGVTDADGFVVLVADPVTGLGDCYGPYRDPAEARGQAEWRRLEFDLDDLADVVVAVVPWHADDDRPRPFGPG